MAKSRTTGQYLKYFITTSLSMAFFGLGLAIALPGPTLPTLAHNLGVNIQEISYIIPARAVGYLLGSFLGGFILGKVNQRFLIFCSLLATSVGLLIIPWINVVPLLAALMSTIGLTMGLLDTGGNVMCLQVWGDKSEPFMQLLHFAFAFGATAGPLVAQPFIMDPGENLTLATSNTSSNGDIFEVTSFRKVSWAFIIAASITAVVSVCFLWLSFVRRHALASSQEDTIASEGTTFRLKILGLLFFFFMVYVGMEVAFGLYIYTFAISYSDSWSKDSATSLNTVFWGLFAVGRFSCIFITRWLSPNSILKCDLVGTLISAILLVCYPLYDESANFLLWGAVGLYGLSIASIFPTGISWAEQYITVNSRAAGVLVVGGALGEMICPFVVGGFISKNPISLMYFTAGCMVVTSILYLLLQIVASRKGKRKLLEPTDSEPGESHETINLLEVQEGFDPIT